MGLSRDMILVVDDESVIINLFKICLSEGGNIEGAANGEEALLKIAEKYYAVIVADVDMPVMNGIDFYTRAVAKYPDVKKRFLFYTGRFEEHRRFFTENNLKYLPKPAHIKDIRKAVTDILDGLAPAVTGETRQT